MSKKGRLIAIIVIVLIIVIVAVLLLKRNKEAGQEVTESTKTTSGLAGINLGGLWGGLFSGKNNNVSSIPSAPPAGRNDWDNVDYWNQMYSNYKRA